MKHLFCEKPVYLKRRKLETISDTRPNDKSKEVTNGSQTGCTGNVSDVE